MKHRMFGRRRVAAHAGARDSSAAVAAAAPEPSSPRRDSPPSLDVPRGNAPPRTFEGAAYCFAARALSSCRQKVAPLAAEARPAAAGVVEALELAGDADLLVVRADLADEALGEDVPLGAAGRDALRGARR